MTFAIDDLAAQLLRARRDDVPLPSLSDALRPPTLDDAYAVSALVQRSLGPIAGWKIGASSARGMAALSLAEPFYATVPHSGVRKEGHWVSARPVTIDAELVFVLAAAPDGTNAAALHDAVGEVRLGLEVNAPRYAAPFSEGGLAIIADGGAHAGLILGPVLDRPAWDDLAAVQASLSRGGTVLARGAASDVFGDPWRALAWLAGALRAHGGRLTQGLVASGNIAFAEVAPGETVQADFGAHGSMRLEVVR